MEEQKKKKVNHLPLVNVLKVEPWAGNPEFELEFTCVNLHVTHRPRKHHMVNGQRVEDNWPKKIRCAECHRRLI